MFGSSEALRGHRVGESVSSRGRRPRRMEDGKVSDGGGCLCTRPVPGTHLTVCRSAWATSRPSSSRLSAVFTTRSTNSGAVKWLAGGIPARSVRPSRSRTLPLGQLVIVRDTLAGCEGAVPDRLARKQS